MLKGYGSVVLYCNIPLQNWLLFTPSHLKHPCSKSSYTLKGDRTLKTLNSNSSKAVVTFQFPRATACMYMYVVTRWLASVHLDHVGHLTHVVTFQWQIFTYFITCPVKTFWQKKRILVVSTNVRLCVNINVLSHIDVEGCVLGDIAYFIRTPSPLNERHDSDRPLSLKLWLLQVPHLTTQYGGHGSARSWSRSLIPTGRVVKSSVDP